MCTAASHSHTSVRHLCVVPTEARRGRCNIWNWNYKHLWFTTWVLGTKPRSSRGAASALNFVATTLKVILYRLLACLLGCNLSYEARCGIFDSWHHAGTPKHLEFGAFFKKISDYSYSHISTWQLSFPITPVTSLSRALLEDTESVSWTRCCVSGKGQRELHSKTD